MYAKYTHMSVSMNMYVTSKNKSERVSLPDTNSDATNDAHAIAGTTTRKNES